MAREMEGQGPSEGARRGQTVRSKPKVGLHPTIATSKAILVETRSAHGSASFPEFERALP